MKLDELLEPQSQLLNERLSTLGKLAALGVAGFTGMVGVGSYNAAQRPPISGERLDISPSAEPRPVAVPPPVPATATAHVAAPSSTPAPATTASGVHVNFPRALHAVHTQQPDQRVAAFTNTLLPMVTAANAAIQADRARAVTVINARNASRADQAWLASIMDRYNARNPSDLLTRLDTVPASLVLAQAAIESGWGMDSIARSGNAFFGQRAWSTTGSIPGPQGERYRAFDHPQHSVASYMHNLNTHAAYEDLRAIRARERAQRRPLRGAALAQGLHKYSTRGPDYVAQVQRLINHRFRQLEPS